MKKQLSLIFGLLIALFLLMATVQGCIRKGIDVELQVLVDPCATGYPECSMEGDAGVFICVDNEGVEQTECEVNCLYGLEPPSDCSDQTGGCYNWAAGQELDVPLVCSKR